MGLLHPDDRATAVSGTLFFWDQDQYMDAAERSANPYNAMYSGGSGLLNDARSVNITRKQIKAAIELFNEGKLNKR